MVLYEFLKGQGSSLVYPLFHINHTISYISKSLR